MCPRWTYIGKRLCPLWTYTKEKDNAIMVSSNREPKAVTEYAGSLFYYAHGQPGGSWPVKPTGVRCGWAGCIFPARFSERRSER